MGGRLRHFAKSWQEVTHDHWVLSVVRNGYSLEFTSPPPVTFYPPRFLQVSALHASVLEETVQGLLAKNAIRLIDPASSAPGFYNHMFLVPKKTGGWRPILNLRGLNKFLKVESFVMETNRAIMAAVQPNDWLVSVDLKDAYFHIAIHEDYWRYLRFSVNGRVYEHTALPFGLATSPRVFTRVVLELVGFLHRQSIRLHPYLDDWLMPNRSRERLQEHLVLSWSVILRLGFIPSLEKSALIPAQDLVFLGMRLWTSRGTVCPTQERIDNLLSFLRSFIHLSCIPARMLLVALGMMVSMLAIVPWARLRVRPIQLYLLALWRPVRQPITQLIPVRPKLRFHLMWWLDQENLLKGVPLNSPPPNKFMFTDASNLGWGAHLDELTASGTWSGDQCKRHINWLELQAVFLALQSFQQSVSHQSVLVSTDNSTVVAYINKMGGPGPRPYVI